MTGPSQERSSLQIRHRSRGCYFFIGQLSHSRLAIGPSQRVQQLLIERGWQAPGKNNVFQRSVLLSCRLKRTDKLDSCLNVFTKDAAMPKNSSNSNNIQRLQHLQGILEETEKDCQCLCHWG